MATPVFSNSPRFCTHLASVGDCMSLTQFNAFTEASATTSSSVNCANQLEAALFRKNIIHQVIKCGGKPIEMNFFMDVFGTQPLKVDSKTVYNHYICDVDFNIFPAASRTATAANTALTFQLLRQNHSGDGKYSFPAVGFTLMDKDNQIMYQITAVDTTTDYAHKITITPNDETVTASVKANTAYLVLDARLVGGYSCPAVTNAAQSIGYVQAVNPLRVRRDWCVQIDLMRGYQDLIQFAVIYDQNGVPQDSWDLYEAQAARNGIRNILNVLSFIGSPTTNAALVTGGGAVIDSQHTGYYGMLNNIKYGGGIVQDYDPAIGWDLDADWQPLLLYQDSLKRATRFMVKHGKAFKAGLIDRTNKLVNRTGTGALMFDSYKRVGQGAAMPDSPETAIEKLGIESYKYLGFNLDFNEWGALSDYRYLGSDYFNNLAIMIPMDGVTENGKPINPIEFYEYGAQYTGGYEEFRRDNRVINGCESIEGYAAQSLAMAMHCPNQFLLINPVKSC